MNKQKERELISRFMAGDKEVFAHFFEAHRRRVLTLALQIVRREETALDVAQETFLRAFEELSRWRGEARLGTWLYRTVVNVSLEHVRAEEKQRRISGFRRTQKTVASPEKIALRNELLAAVDRAVSDLPPRQRTVFVLKNYRCLRFSEIAPLLGLTEGGVKASYHKALTTLREKLRLWAPPEREPKTETVSEAALTALQPVVGGAGRHVAVRPEIEKGLRRRLLPASADGKHS